MVTQELESQLWQLNSCSWLKLSKAGKDYELAAEGWECFLQEVCKEKRDSANLSG